MPSTTLALLQSFLRLKGLEVPASLYGATEAGPLQLLEIYLKTGRHLRQKRQWQALKRRVTYVTDGTESSGKTFTAVLGELPDHVIFDTVWDNTARVPVYGPLDDVAYQQRQALIPTGPLYEFYIRDNKIYIVGGMPASHTLAFIFQSDNWVQTTTSSGVYQDTITADANSAVFPDNLMTLGIEAFWRKEKGLEFATYLADFEMQILSKVEGIPGKIRMHESQQPVVRPAIIVPGTGYS